jgi:energy-coupling factor transporter ATP-binding protein EcfA2
MRNRGQRSNRRVFTQPRSGAVDPYSRTICCLLAGTRSSGVPGIDAFHSRSLIFSKALFFFTATSPRFTFRSAFAPKFVICLFAKNCVTEAKLINQIYLENFRRFERFRLVLQPGNILVGPNNSGKSSILDALRILEACLRHTKTRNPRLLDIPGAGVFDGYEVPDSVLPVTLSNITHDYSDNDAVLRFAMNEKQAIIRMHPDKLTKFYIDTGGPRLTTSSTFRSAFAVKFVIVPTLSALEVQELHVIDETVQRNRVNKLASRVLRNIWLRETDLEFEKFRTEIRATWKAIDIRKPELVKSQPPIVQMFYSENRREREVSWAGFGFQAWLQIQTHLRRAEANAILVIDEPDVYLHPDLQRKLLKNIRESFSQFVLATHSVEIINEAEPKEVVAINPENKSGTRVSSDEQYSRLFEYIGSGSNADFARIAKAKRVIFVEGADGRLLRRFAARFNFDALNDSSAVPIIRLGGFSRWPLAEHAAWAFKEILGLEIEILCVFDRDYRSDEEVAAFLDHLTAQSIQAHVLKRKEIENYLLEPSAICKAVAKRLQERKSEIAAPSSERVAELLIGITEPLKDEVFSQRSSKLIKFKKSTGSGSDEATIIKQAYREADKHWKTLEGRINISPGKQVLSEFNSILQNEFSVSLTPLGVVTSFAKENVPSDLHELLETLNTFCNVE